MIRRRQFLTAAFAAVGAAGLAFGSQAFTQTEADRNLDLAIAPDDASVLALKPSGVESDAVTTEDGVLAIDAGDLPINTGGTATVGRFENVDIDDPGQFETQAFLIRNNSGNPIDIEFDFEDVGDTTLELVVTNPGVTEPQDEPADIPDETTSVRDGDEGVGLDGSLESGEAVYGALIVQAESIDNGEIEIDADVRIRAEWTDQ